MILATKKKSEQLLNVLTDAGADADVKDVQSNLNSYVPTIIMILFIYTLQTEEKMTALMFAVKVGSLDVVKLLVEKSNADLFAVNSVSTTE